jgi:SH3-like domain-containing protein
MRDQPAALPDQPAAAPKKENVLVVIRGPANIRSAPDKKGRVIGTAPKDANVKELDRAGNWVQVETEAGTGWINATLLGSPESR